MKKMMAGDEKVIQYRLLFLVSLYFLFATTLFISNFAIAATNQQIQLAEAKDFAHMTIEDLANIEITSVSRQVERLQEAPASVVVITNEDIRRSGATSIPEALRLAHNLHVAQKNAYGWAISARGFNTELGNKLLVLMDGRTVYTPLFSGVFWDRQDYLLEDIERIEVISGPGSTLWGANAVNGVINIITKVTKDTQGLYVETAAGTKLNNATAVRYGGQLAPEVNYRLYGKYADRESQEFENGRSASDAWNFSQGGFRIDAKATPQDSLTLQGDFYGAEEEDPSTGREGHASGLNLLTRWNHRISADSEMKLQLYYDRTSFSLPTRAATPPQLGAAGTLKDTLDTYDLDFQHNFRLNQYNQVVWGLGYRHTRDEVDSSPTLASESVHLNQDLYSAFIQDEIKLNEKLFLTMGTKIEHNDFTGWEYEPSARMQWDAGINHMLWGAVSRAVRIPSRLDRQLRIPTNLPAPFPQSLLNGSDQFVSEKVIAYELGYRAQLNPKFSTSITAFYNEYDDIRSVNPNLPTSVFVINNNLKGETYGLELSGNYQASNWWRLHFGYSLLKENIRVKSGEVDVNNGLNETADPNHQVLLSSSMRLPHNMDLDAHLRWIDTVYNNRGPVVGKVPSYTELNIRLGWRPTKKLELSLTGQNLLNDRHPEFGFPTATRIEISRSVYGKVQWRF